MSEPEKPSLFVFLAERVIYFLVAFPIVVCMSLRATHPPESPYYWYWITGSSLLVALVGPPIYHLYRARHRNSLF